MSFLPNPNALIDNAMPTPYTPINVSIYQYLKDHAASYASMCALSFYHVQITFDDLFHAIDQVECALRAHGVKQGDRVAVSLPGIPEAVYLFYAINKIGAVYCAVDCRCKSNELIEIFSELNPKLAFISDFHLPEFRTISYLPLIYLRADRSLGKTSSVSAVFRDLFTGRLSVFYHMNNLLSYDTFLKTPFNDSISNDHAVNHLHDTAALFYTSGTTNGRKCVRLTNENINSAVYQQAFSNRHHSPGDIFLNIMPPFTCYGITLGLHLPLCVGIEVRLYPLFRAKKLATILKKAHPNMVITVPSHWEAFIKHPPKATDLSCLKIVIIGGDTLSAVYRQQIKTALHSCQCQAILSNGYGLTETASTAISPNEKTPIGSIGQACCWTSVTIIDPLTGQQLPCGKHGEICISGPSICQGYLNDPQSTNALLHLHDDGKIWLHSGDIGYKDDKGNIYFVERIKRMYIRYDGTKMSPYAIEQALLACPAVDRCLVVAAPDPAHSHGMCPHAIIVKAGALSTRQAKAQLEKHIRFHLAEHMRPSSIHFVQELPSTKNGKIAYFHEAGCLTSKQL